MSNLTNLQIAQGFGDILSCTNPTPGGGLTNTLQQVQDGRGNPSTMSISQIAVNFSRSGGTFQLDGVALNALAADINNVCKANPILPGTSGVKISMGTTAQRPDAATNAGVLRYNTDTNQLEFSNGTTWRVIQST